ncbi:MAG: hypothetical protein GX352_08565 [Clostridiales bacterium]|nr:hypothetical protein [Clostridiales bacterium]
MYLIYASMVICTALFILTAVWIKLKKPKRTDRELVRVSEVPETAIMGAMLLLFTYFILLAKYFDPSVGGSDDTSYRFVSAMAVIAALVASEIFLTVFVKKVIAYEDKVEYIQAFGIKSTIPWSEIIKIKVPVIGKKIVLSSAKDSISVNGSKKEYIQFLKIANKRIPNAAKNDDFIRLIKNINGA